MKRHRASCRKPTNLRAWIGAVVLSVFATTSAFGASSFLELAKLLSQDGGAGGELGWSVAIDGKTMAIGSPGDGDLGFDAGAVYVFEQGPLGQWEEVAKLVASDGGDDHTFGDRVAIDGDVLVVGARRTFTALPEAVYIFERGGDGIWVETIQLASANCEVSAVDFAVSGDTIVVGDPLDDDNGEDAGAACVFEKNNTTGLWDEGPKLLASDGQAHDRFGTPAIHESTLVIGASGEYWFGAAVGGAYVFEHDGNGWVEVAKLLTADGVPGSGAGASVALDGDRAILSATALNHERGAAYLFERDDQGAWAQVQKLVASDREDSDGLSTSVDISGDTIALGAEVNQTTGQDGTGSVYIFEPDGGGGWTETVKLLASDGMPGDAFGRSVAVDGSTVLIGAEGDENQNGGEAGAAYWFTSSPVLQLEGTCPGQMTFTYTSPDPNPGLLFIAGAEGAAPLPPGTCGGTPSGLDNPRRLRRFPTDAGQRVFVRTLSSSECGRYVQAFDAGTCKGGNVVRLPP